ncbi:Hypothetical_protein [Hexamita inflata]|uniref:Hypothetical_protein n=1 Tax=Hexamita inflata TaxID=28002 RepID=A0AA86PJZ9_9EUKA|nr:Hypothetical protein HINF_LOCUS27431 [Hexamita inflata]CAI9972147.1 Hypothetical protein HINF_LOCUS59792 [Hexamita inflata]
MINQMVKWVLTVKYTGVFEVMNFKINDVQKAIYYKNEWFAVQKEVIQVFSQEHVCQYQEEITRKNVNNVNVVVSEGISGQGREIVVYMDQQVVVEYTRSIITYFIIWQKNKQICAPYLAEKCIKNFSIVEI